MNKSKMLKDLLSTPIELGFRQNDTVEQNINITINNLKDCIKKLEEITKTHQENIQIFKTLIEQLEEWKEK